MIILDTNVYIYIANRTLSARIIAGQTVAYASVTRIEALGFRDLSVGEANRLLEAFRIASQFDLTEEVVLWAILLKQERKMGLGDAIVAATALEHDCELWTANTEDFKRIDGLKLYNPLEP